MHHRTYERVGAELPGDLIVLCDICHGLFHEAARIPVQSPTSVDPFDQTLATLRRASRSVRAHANPEKPAA